MQYPIFLVPILASRLFLLAPGLSSPFDPASQYSYTQCVDGTGWFELVESNQTICSSFCNKAVVSPTGEDWGRLCREQTDYPNRIIRYLDTHEVSGCWDKNSKTYVMPVPVELFRDCNWTHGVMTLWTKMLSPACIGGDWLFELSGGFDHGQCTGPKSPVLWTHNIHVDGVQMHIDVSEALSPQWDHKWGGIKRGGEVAAVKIQSTAPYCILNNTHHQRSIYRIYALGEEQGERNYQPIQAASSVDKVRFRRWHDQVMGH